MFYDVTVSCSCKTEK